MAAMSSRFFLVPFLPGLAFDAQPELSLDDLDFFLQLNLSSSEMAAVNQLYSLVNLENVRSFFTGLPMASLGTIPHEELREQLENEECSLPGVFEFVTQYKTPEERAEHARLLPRYFFANIPLKLPSFVSAYFQFEHTTRLLTASLRAEALGRPFEEVDFDIHDQKAWPELFSPLLSMWQARHTDPKELEEAFSAWKFQALGSLIVDSAPFSLDHVLAYLLQLRLLEERREMKTASHVSTLERIVEAVK